MSVILLIGMGGVGAHLVAPRPTEPPIPPLVGLLIIGMIGAFVVTGVRWITRILTNLRMQITDEGLVLPGIFAPRRLAWRDIQRVKDDPPALHLITAQGTITINLLVFRHPEEFRAVLQQGMSQAPTASTTD